MPLLPETPSPLASFKSRLVLHYWYQLTQVVLEKKPLNGCSSSSSSYEIDSILITTIISNAVHYWYTAEKNWKTKFGVENRKWNTPLHLLCLQNDRRCNSEVFELVSDLQKMPIRTKSPKLPMIITYRATLSVSSTTTGFMWLCVSLTSGGTASLLTEDMALDSSS